MQLAREIHVRLAPRLGVLPPLYGVPEPGVNDRCEAVGRSHNLLVRRIVGDVAQLRRGAAVAQRVLGDAAVRFVAQDVRDLCGLPTTTLCAPDPLGVECVRDLLERCPVGVPCEDAADERDRRGVPGSKLDAQVAERLAITP